MNPEDIIAMAREAGFEELFDNSSDWVCFTDEIEKFAALVAAAERNECAKVCEAGGLLWGQWYADAIRARGEQK